MARARVLVVGGAGFVGSNLVRRCLELGCPRVLVVDNLLSSEADNLPEDPRVELRVASIADDVALSGLDDEFDLAFHLATYHGNQSSMADPVADHANNLTTTVKLFQRLSGFRRLRRVVYSAAGCALAAKGDGPATAAEESDVAPLDLDTPYQISKVAGEMYALYFHRACGLPVVRARFQNVYGPGEVLGAGRWRGTPETVWRNVVPAFAYRALRGLPLRVHGRGESTRDFIYVGDVVDGLLRCATTPGIEGDVFNLASGRETSILRLAEAIVRLAGGASRIEFAPARPWDRSIHRVGSTRKSSARLGFEARVGLEDGLGMTLEWTRRELSRIERCMLKHSAHYAPELGVA